MIKERKDLIYLKEMNFVIFTFASCIDLCSFSCVYIILRLVKLVKLIKFYFF